MVRTGLEPATYGFPVQLSNHSATLPPHCSMTVVAVVERSLPLMSLRANDTESDKVSCGVGGVPAGCWVRTECRCSLEALLVVG